MHSAMLVIPGDSIPRDVKNHVVWSIAWHISYWQYTSLKHEWLHSFFEGWLISFDNLQMRETEERQSGRCWVCNCPGFFWGHWHNAMQLKQYRKAPPVMIPDQDGTVQVRSSGRIGLKADYGSNAIWLILRILQGCECEASSTTSRRMKANITLIISPGWAHVVVL